MHFCRMQSLNTRAGHSCVGGRFELVLLLLQLLTATITMPMEEQHAFHSWVDWLTSRDNDDD